MCHALAAAIKTNRARAAAGKPVTIDGKKMSAASYKAKYGTGAKSRSSRR